VLLRLFNIKIAKAIYSKKVINIVIKSYFINKLAKYAKKLIFEAL